jgi:hypothetical protein
MTIRQKTFREINGPDRFSVIAVYINGRNGEESLKDITVHKYVPLENPEDSDDNRSGSGKHKLQKLEGTFVSVKRMKEICYMQQMTGTLNPEERAGLMNYAREENYLGERGFVLYFNSRGDDLRRSRCLELERV